VALSSGLFDDREMKCCTIHLGVKLLWPHHLSDASSMLGSSAPRYVKPVLSGR
jgi:hypothetical protein